MEKIQPKPTPFIEKRIVTPSLNLKGIGNSVQDKRKLLEMELEKLKEQAKKQSEKTVTAPTATATATTTTTTLKSYPSSATLKAEKEMKGKVSDVNLDSPVSNKKMNVLAQNNLIYLTIPSAIVSVKDQQDSFALTPFKTNLEIFEGNTSPTYIFYDESDMIAEESEEMLVGEQFYVLED